VLVIFGPLDLLHSLGSGTGSHRCGGGVPAFYHLQIPNKPGDQVQCDDDSDLLIYPSHLLQWPNHQSLAIVCFFLIRKVKEDIDDPVLDSSIGKPAAGVNVSIEVISLDALDSSPQDFPKSLAMGYVFFVHDCMIGIHMTVLYRADRLGKRTVMDDVLPSLTPR